MKISGVKVHYLEWKRGSYHWRDGIMPSGPMGRSALLRIQTDEGMEGISPCGWGINVREVKWQLSGQNPLDRERIWQSFWRNLRTSNLGEAIGPVDVALWDLQGKLTNQPVYRLLGGMRDRIPAYASTVTFESIQDYLDNADQYLERGFRAIKLHAWGRFDQDAELCRALRKHVGDEIPLMYDASSMFNNYEEAVQFGRVLEEQNFTWYEEPMDHFNMTVLARLSGELHIPVAVAEATHGGPFDALAQIRAGAGDIILTGPLDAYKGGFTGVLKTAHICEGYGMMCAIHGSSIACLHAACAIYNTRFFERVEPARFFAPPGFIDASTQIDSDGYASPGEKPGLGIELDWDWIKQHTIKVED
ncbi:MAG TPA: enolase C-terminal domain-like protein [Anaerolineaceae bacterium]